jgi:hypothetical protein
LHAWAKLLASDFLADKGILIAKGTPNVPYSVSLAIAHASNFAILLDRDDEGNAAADKLVKDMNISKEAIVQPHNSMGIEDAFSAQDFRALLVEFDPNLKLEANQRPCAAIKRLGVDKVLLARKFAELVNDRKLERKDLTDKTLEATANIFVALANAIQVDPIFRMT